MSYDKEAFFQVCNDAKPARASYVSLYVDLPYYGGPEEGGWWGSDTKLVAYHQVSNDEEAQAVRAKVVELSKALTADAEESFGRQCVNELEWLEARGLDSDYLPEVDGSERYWVAIESRPGELVHEGSRHYE